MPVAGALGRRRPAQGQKRMVPVRNPAIFPASSLPGTSSAARSDVRLHQPVERDRRGHGGRFFNHVLRDIFPRALFSLDLKYPWIKWLLDRHPRSAPPRWTLLRLRVRFFSFATVAWVAPWMGAYSRVVMIVAMASIFIYFISIGQKASTATSPDVETPTEDPPSRFDDRQYSTINYCSHLSVHGERSWRWHPSFHFSRRSSFIFALFPISLAYVVVVHRAMDPADTPPPGDQICPGALVAVVPPRFDRSAPRCTPGHRARAPPR